MNSKAPLASPTFTGTPLAPTAATGTNTTQIATTSFVTSAINASNPTHYIGESYGGGIVFYVYDNGQHGLIAAIADQSAGIRWYGGTYTNTSAKGSGVGAGLINTAIIIANQGPVDGVSFAARVCNEYSKFVDNVVYGDWYLPSGIELASLLQYKNVVGGFADASYWCSIEYDSRNAYSYNFGTSTSTISDKSSALHVRAIRAF